MVRMIDISSCNQKALHNLLLTILGSPDQWKHWQQINNIIAFCFCGQFQRIHSELFPISRFHSMRQYLIRMVDISSWTQERLNNLNVTFVGSTKQSCPSILSCVSRFHTMRKYLVRRIDISSWTQKHLYNLNVTWRGSMYQSCVSILWVVSRWKFNEAIHGQDDWHQLLQSKSASQPLADHLGQPRSMGALSTV